MNKALLFILTLGIVQPIYARHISAERAEEIAAKYLGTPEVQAPVRFNVASSNASTPAYYVYNRHTGGFVIVSADDRLGEILGYSNTGNISTSMPDGMDYLLGLYSVAYNALPQEDKSGSAIVSSTPQEVVKPLLGDIVWGQAEPFNSLTPKQSNGTNFYTGCVACAATQIMRHYSYPQKGTGSKTYTDPLSKNTLTGDFGSTEYLWDSMPASVPENPSAAQKTAYSTLAAHFGIAVEMQYEANGSGTYDMLVPYALRNYFGYDAAIRSHERSYYSTSEWMGMIKNELAQGRPIFYGGTSDNGTGGHAFVIDGYDSQDFVHVNWGWYGNSNGYFRINHLDPSKLGEGGGAGGYNLNQDMVTGIRPSQAGSARDYAIYGETRISVDGPYNGSFTMMCYVGNLDVDPFEGRVEGALVKDGKIVAVLGGSDISLPGYAKGHSGAALTTLRNVANTVTGVADGDGYVLAMAYRGKEETEWKVLRHPSGLPSRANASVSGGNIILGEKHIPYPAPKLHSAIVTDGDVYAGGHGRATFDMESSTGDFDISKITLRLVSDKDPKVFSDADIDVSVYNQSVERVDVLFPVDSTLAAGRYRIDALIKSNGKEYPFELNGFEATYVTVHPAAAAPVIRAVGTPVWQVNNSTAAVPDRLAQGEYLYITGAFRNAGAPGKARILARLANTATGLSSPMIMAEVTFTNEKTASVTFSRQIAQDPGTYTVEFLQVDEQYGMTALSAPGEKLVITVDPSASIPAEVTAFTIPESMQKGVAVPYSITAKGLLTATTTLYIRVRQLTAKNGEIVTMKSGVKFVPGEEITVSGNYKPSTSLEDGIYMFIFEAGPSSSKTQPLGNHAKYAQTVVIGNVSGIDDILVPEQSASIWVEGRTLLIEPSQNRTVAHIQIFNISGTSAAVDTTDLSGLATGAYIVVAILDDGSAAHAKIII